jgi:hypothetical protein
MIVGEKSSFPKLITKALNGMPMKFLTGFTFIPLNSLIPKAKSINTRELSL